MFFIPAICISLCALSTSFMRPSIETYSSAFEALYRLLLSHILKLKEWKLSSYLKYVFVD